MLIILKNHLKVFSRLSVVSDELEPRNRFINHLSRLKYASPNPGNQYAYKLIFLPIAHNNFDILC